MKKKIMVVFGTRPEAIKMAPVVKALQERCEEFETIVTVTGQHRQMLDQVLDIFGILPDYDLNIMRSGQDLTDVSCRVLSGMRDIFENKCRPDIVLVHGDTSTSTFAAIAAFYAHIKVGHVEAGLRTHDRLSPWPEEMNRQITGRIADYHFSPTVLSRENLIKENVDEKSIFITGNTVIDALHIVVDRMKKDEGLVAEIDNGLRLSGYDVDRLSTGRKMVLITGHRRENFGDGFISMCSAIKDLALKYKDIDFVYPMHLNPNVRKPIQSIFGDLNNRKDNLYFIEPLEYLAFIRMMSKAYIVLTDSGGIQEEAPGLGKPVVVMRDTTERPEAVEAGTVKLVGTDYDKIISTVSTLIDDNSVYQSMSRAVNPYGDGKAAGRIVKILSE
ncbi:MAG: UDP-N-acetylglucosamine 2-epimerase (non-hydrolyzing) [Bacteroides sp.]|nr:UDP-N-acetylglucosamine 2-epimerase (non-hydrolyzing) [Bacteroides sp.]MCM1390236.1 UDP-N-acetylglucosamine 2-epimerase (non-hydrolyzing) [Bacteroides sp.]